MEHLIIAYILLLYGWDLKCVSLLVLSTSYVMVSEISWLVDQARTIFGGMAKGKMSFAKHDSRLSARFFENPPCQRKVPLYQIVLPFHFCVLRSCLRTLARDNLGTGPNFPHCFQKFLVSTKSPLVPNNPPFP